MTYTMRFVSDQSESPSANGTSLFIAGDLILPEEQTHTSPVGPKIRRRVEQADLAVVNLEAPVTNEPPPFQKSGPTKHTAPQTPTLLADIGFDGVTLANNHTMDYGVEGLTETITSCSAAGLSVVGAGQSIDDALTPLHERIDGTRIAIVNLCEREFGGADADREGTAWLCHPAACSHVQAACDTADIVIAIVHGGVEYVPLPPPHLQATFRNLVDRGVDLVVGHHPHVPQGWERYGNGGIVYSLGNFVFRQSKREKTRRGIVLDVSIEGTDLDTVEVVPTEQRDGAVAESTGQDGRELINHLQRSAGTIQDREALEAHWQAQAVRIFHQRYTRWLTTGVGANAQQLARYPLRIPDLNGQWDLEERAEDLLILLNLFRNDSHRAVIQTALEVETGVVPDRRTPEIEATVDDLLTWTEDKPLENRVTRFRRRLSAIVDRLPLISHHRERPSRTTSR